MVCGTSLPGDPPVCCKFKSEALIYPYYQARSLSPGRAGNTTRKKICPPGAEVVNVGAGAFCILDLGTQVCHDAGSGWQCCKKTPSGELQCPGPVPPGLQSFLQAKMRPSQRRMRRSARRRGSRV